MGRADGAARAAPGAGVAAMVFHRVETLRLEIAQVPEFDELKRAENEPVVPLQFQSR